MLAIYNKWSKNFYERPHRKKKFSQGQCNVTPTSRQHCSMLLQWRCGAVNDIFAAYNATLSHNAF